MSQPEPPRLYIGPPGSDLFEDAARQAGARSVDLEDAQAILFTGDDRDPAQLTRLIHPGIRWVQLPQVGVERWAAAGVLSAGPVFTCARGAFSEATAEHAMAFLLAAARRLDEAIRATSWQPLPARELHGAHIVIAGGGAVAGQLVTMLAPFHARITVVSDQAQIPDADVVPRRGLESALRTADYAVLLVASTPETRGMIGARQLAALPAHAWLINVARGPVVDTPALVAALEGDRIGGAALDVTDPEPLPDGHPLWSLPHVIITPHSATPRSAYARGMSALIQDNVRRFAAGHELLGLVDPHRGY